MPDLNELKKFITQSETRESVLLSNESRLKEAIALARRRDGILGKII